VLFPQGYDSLTRTNLVYASWTFYRVLTKVLYL